MVEMYLGQREQIAWVDEAGGYGALGGNTIADDGEVIGKNATFTPDFNQGWQKILSAGADSREIADLEQGPLQYKFTLNFTPVNWKFLMFCAHGSVADAGSDPYTHTFSLSDAVQSFTCEWAKRGSTNEVITLTGCVIKRLTLRFSKGTGDTDGLITVEAECIAQSVSKGTSISSVSAPTADGFKFHHVKLTYSGSEFVEINNGELTIDNGIDEEDSRYANSTLNRTIGEPVPKTVVYGLSLNVNQKDSTFTDDWIAAVNVSSTNKLEIIRGSNDDVDFTFTNLFLESVNAPSNLDGIDTQDVVGSPLSTAIVATDSIATYF